MSHKSFTELDLSSQVPRSQDFVYASFVEVLCPVCEESSLWPTKAAAKQWARDHKWDHQS
jgi:hypothetical protein